MNLTIELERLVRTSDLHGPAMPTQQAVLAASARQAPQDRPTWSRTRLPSSSEQAGEADTGTEFLRDPQMPAT
ncbi:hypothetical protein [Micromonospora sp. NPDC049891]|uniref:hypothetical protein n=1 Tax=Micromonospora sp. NPDC049891 TaxID=3155655 RepID=UPI00340C0E09